MCPIAGTAISSSSELECTFNESTCCWHNIGGGRDDLDWMVLRQDPPLHTLNDLFGVGVLPSWSLPCTS